MISKIKFWLRRPYYFNHSISYRFMISFWFSFFVFIFLYFLTPFNLIKLENFLLKYVLGLSLIVFLVLIFLFFLLPLVFKNFFKKDKWTIGKNVLFIIVTLFTTSFFLWFYNFKIKSSYGLQPLSLGRFIYYTFVVGLFPSILVIFFNERNVRIKKMKNVEEILSLKKVEKIKIPKQIYFTSIDTKESILITIKDLVYITSQSNYACFFINENNSLKEYIIRITLKKVEQQLSNYTEFYRCHKSYIVNANFINNLEGNARGYQLITSIDAIKIPVSRKFPKELLKKIIK